MLNCYQFETMNVLQHGQSVVEYFDDLMGYISAGREPKKQWRLPDWIDKIGPEDLVDYETIRTYLTYHDCGKPFCRVVDQEGKQHFPNHAEVSYRQWLRYSDDREIANLIRSDMDIHLLRPDGVEEFKSRPEAPTLLIAGLCEIHSNATMFGGIESESFKIKWKRINKLGGRIVR